MEQRGIAISWSAIRFAYSMGGDGESDIKIDLQNAVAYARDRVAVVTCLMLPLYCSIHVNMQVCDYIRVVTCLLLPLYCSFHKSAL